MINCVPREDVAMPREASSIPHCANGADQGAQWELEQGTRLGPNYNGLDIQNGLDILDSAGWAPVSACFLWTILDFHFVGVVSRLESHPGFLLLLLTGGLQYPKISAAAGCVYLLGRIAYAKGYYTGDPTNRKWGTFGYIGSLVLLGNAISFATHQLGYFDTRCGRY